MEGGKTDFPNSWWWPNALRYRLAALSIALVWLAAAASECRATVLEGARLIPEGPGVLLQFQFSGPTRARIGHAGGRLMVDLPGTSLELPVRPLFGKERAPVMAVRTVESEAGSRIQIDVSGESAYTAGWRGSRLLIGIQPSGAGVDFPAIFAAMPAPAMPVTGSPRTVARAARQIPAQPARIHMARAPAASAAPHGPRPAANPGEVRSAPVLASLSAAGSQAQPLVVVDPGHGGFDPGTRSQQGVLEKDLALQVALRLSAALNRRGIRTLLTRDSDSYITLHDRVALANRAGADLFVSVHMNWSPDSEASGMQVYYLNNTTDRATLRLARMENNGEYAVSGAPSNLNYILSDLRQQYKANESSVLAQDMEQQTVSQLRADFGDAIHGLGARRGPFYVLVGAEMPAVLVECGFLSNPGEAALLQSGAYQQALADSLANTIVQYLNNEITAGTL